MLSEYLAMDFSKSCSPALLLASPFLVYPGRLSSHAILGFGNENSNFHALALPFCSKLQHCRFVSSDVGVSYLPLVY